MFGGDDDDQDFLSPGGSKLHSLFGMDKASSTSGNASLTYTAPKQPKKKQEQAAGGTAILKACAVHAYKLVNGAYVSQGQVGSAILANHKEKDFKILLYYSKQQQLTHARVTSNLTLTVQPNNYLSFYDEKQVNWSLMFPSEQNISDFLKQVALCKASFSNNSSLIGQDLTLGEGGGLERDDSVEVRYTGWLLVNFTFGDVFDTNTNSDKLFRFRVGKGKVIRGWDEGVVGMSKNSKRLLIVPSNLAYGSKGAGNRVPPNATLIFEIEVVRVKLLKEKESPESSSQSSPAPETPPVDIEPESASDDVKTRSRSLSDHLSQSPKSEKAKLITKIAKMGQAMLPTQSLPSGEDEEDVTTAVHDEQHHPTAEAVPVATAPPKPHIAHKPVHAAPVHPHPAVVTQQIPIIQQQQHQLQQHQLQQHQLQQHQLQQQPNIFAPTLMTNPMQAMQPPSASLAVYQPPVQPFIQNPQIPQYYQTQAPAAAPPATSTVAPPTTSTASETHLPVLLQQNTEVRLSISKVTDKLDRIMDKVDSLHTHTMSQASVHNNMPNMETAMLFQNLQRIIQDNDRLKKDLFEKSQKIEQQNDKITELLSRNQSYVERSNKDLEDRHQSMNLSTTQTHSRVLQLEQEKVSLASQLADMTGQVSNLQLEIRDMKLKNSEIKQQLHDTLTSKEGSNEELTRLRLQIAESESKLGEQLKTLRDEKLTRKSVEAQLTTLQEEMTDLKTTNTTLEKNLAERKKKSVEEKKRFEEDLEEQKTQHEAELHTLRNKLKHHKTQTDSTVSEQVSQIEQELNAEWQSKYDRLQTSLDDKHSRAIKELIEEKEQISQKYKDMEEKYDNLRGQAATMKKRYEDRINQLIEQRDEAVEQRDDAIHKAEAASAAPPPAPTPVAPELNRDILIAEVKKIMNTVFYQLRARFPADRRYSGARIIQVLLNTIKEVTLKLVNGEDPSTIVVQPEEESEEESEEEEEEEEEASADEDESESEREEEREPEPRISNVPQNETRAAVNELSLNGAIADDNPSADIPSNDSSIPISFTKQPSIVEVAPDIVESAPRDAIPDVLVSQNSTLPEVLSGVQQQQQSDITTVDLVSLPQENNIETREEIPESDENDAVVDDVPDDIPEIVEISSQEMEKPAVPVESPPAQEQTTSGTEDFADVTETSAEKDVETETKNEEQKSSQNNEEAMKATEAVLREALTVPTRTDPADSDGEEPWREAPPDLPELNDEDVKSIPDDMNHGEPDLVKSNHVDETAAREEKEKDNEVTSAVGADDDDLTSSVMGGDPLFTELKYSNDNDSKKKNEVEKLETQDDEPLFGDIDDDHDPFGVGQATTTTKKKPSAIDDKKLKTSTNDVDSDDGRPQPPPPPLFGDDDDDDLDWLN
ncbi:FK506-binding protein 15-like isoform X2 [Tubulanus polymorphus]|uniref:FK506-binding protein 15-like isoform X2 n=1 Tax=Tubulanus polymorphus TaxID=672921 RepID=UPI003DA33D14